MAYREVPMVEAKEVLRLWLTGLGKKRIAAWVGLDPKTVRRYVTAAEQLGLRSLDGEAALSDDLVGEVLELVQGRPGRMRGETRALCAGHTEVIDADLSAYFDSIPHADLMKALARRLSDRRLLRLLERCRHRPHTTPAADGAQINPSPGTLLVILTG